MCKYTVEFQIKYSNNELVFGTVWCLYRTDNILEFAVFIRFRYFDFIKNFGCFSVLFVITGTRKRQLPNTTVNSYLVFK